MHMHVLNWPRTCMCVMSKGCQQHLSVLHNSDAHAGCVLWSTLVCIYHSFYSEEVSFRCLNAVLTDWETKNKYRVRNTLGQDVYFAAEGNLIINLPPFFNVTLSALERREWGWCQSVALVVCMYFELSIGFLAATTYAWDERAFEPTTPSSQG